LKKYLLYGIGICLSLHLAAQDAHWTQWYYVPQSVNPAYSGIKEHTLEAGAIYRNQWQNVPVGFNTFMLFGNTDIQKEKIKNVTLGGTILHDIAGASKFTTDQVNFSIGYKKYFLEKNLLLSFAVQPNWKTAGFKTNDLTFGKNYNGERYDASLNNGETFLNQRSSSFSLNTGLVAIYRYEKFHFTLGYARFYDAGKNKNALSNLKIKAEQRQNITSGAQYEYSKKTKLKFDLALYFIDKQKEWINAYTITHQPNLKKSEFLSASIMHRNKDAVSLGVGYEKNEWQGFFAYDFNVSKFKVATRYQGAFEIGVKYTYQLPGIIKRKYRQCVIYI
jgi:type IX secretion system PorP/SprF family membrane protein